MQAAVLGNAGCGKTSLIRALVGLPFDADSPPTEKRTSFRSPLIGKDSMFIDCGHIEDEEALRNLLQGSKVNCVILCYDCSNPASLQSVQTDWLDAVLACKLKLFLILVGLKSELRHHGMDSAQILDFANERNLFSLQVSAKLGENVGLLLEVLQQRMPAALTVKPGPTTLQFHRSGSVDLTSPALNLHLSSDGQVRQQQQLAAQPPMFPLYVDVRTGSVAGTIAVRSQHDDALQLARQFLSQHGLDANRAPDLAKIIQARLAEFFVQRRPTTPGLLTSAATPSKKILARLSVVVNPGVTAVVVVREGDDVARVVDAFRRTYDLRKDDLVVEELYDRVQMALQRGGVGDEEEEDLRQLLLEDRPEEEEPSRSSKKKKNNGTARRRRKERAPSVSSSSSSSSSEEELVVERKKKKRSVARKSFDEEEEEEEQQPVRKSREQTRRRRGSTSSSVEEEEQQDMLIEQLRKSSLDQPRPPLQSGRRVSMQQQHDDEEATPMPISASRRNSRQDPARSPISSPASRKSRQQPQQNYYYEEEEEEDMMSVFGEDEYNDVMSHGRRPYHQQPPPPPPHSASRRGSNDNGIPRPFPSGRSAIASTNTLRRMPGAPTPPPPPPSRYSARGTAAAAAPPPPPPASRYTSPNMPRYLASTAASRSFSSVPAPHVPVSAARPILFYVDVNLGGKTERIAVCKNDNLQELAERFLEDHRLPKTKLAKLTQLLDVHLKQHQRNRRTML